MHRITVVGGGFAGLTAAITVAAFNSALAAVSLALGRRTLDLKRA